MHGYSQSHCGGMGDATLSPGNVLVEESFFHFQAASCPTGYRVRSEGGRGWGSCSCHNSGALFVSTSAHLSSQHNTLGGFTFC